MASIIVPTNFSHCAVNAAHYAADLALAVKADLVLLHVIEAPVTSAELMMTPEVYQEMLETANASLKELQDKLDRHTHQKIRIETVLEAGDTASKVEDLCRQRKPYAVVLGAAGPTFEKFLGGSPVASLLHDLTCPVLIVPETARFQHFRRVLLACDPVDIQSGMSGSLPLLEDLRDHFGSRFDAVTVEKSGTSSPFLCEVWQEKLKDLYPDVHSIHTSHIEKGILDYLDQQDTDLVMVFPKKHRLFDFHVSQSGKLAQHSPVPVLSMHGSF